MAANLPHLFIGGYGFDVLTLLRMLLSIWAIHYYDVFGKRIDAVFYHYKTRQMTFVFFFLEALSDTLLDVMENVPMLLVLREIGQIGAAYTIYSASEKTLRYGSLIVLALPFLLTGQAQIAGWNIDALALLSMAIVLLAVRNYTRAGIAAKLDAGHDLIRKAFLFSLFFSYVLQFTSALWGVDLFPLVEIFETITVMIGFYTVRSVAVTGKL